MCRACAAHVSRTYRVNHRANHIVIESDIAIFGKFLPELRASEYR